MMFAVLQFKYLHLYSASNAQWGKLSGEHGRPPASTSWSLSIVSIPSTLPKAKSPATGVAATRL